jgi:hypothetical protein
VSSSVKLVVRGKHINEITLGNSYKVENVGIKEFNVKYLSTNPSTLITKEADIGPVTEEDTETELMDYTGKSSMSSSSSIKWVLFCSWKN